MNVVALDCETHLIGPGAIAPRLVCASFAAFEASTGTVGGVLYSTADPELEPLIFGLLKDEDTLLVFHNAPYDLAVIAAYWPYMMPAIFEKLEKGHVTDTKTREKLLNLSTTGQLTTREFPDGSNERVRYRLEDLVLRYTGRDRSGEKTGDDSQQLNFHTLDGVSAADYPDESAKYALDDALDTYEVYMLQAEKVQNESGYASVATENFQAAVDFTLMLQTCWGFAVDREAVGVVDTMLAEAMAPEKMELLLKEKVLIPGHEGLPYANGAKNEDGTPKLTLPQKDVIKKKLLQEFVRAVSIKNRIEVKMTAPSDTYPAGQVATGKEVIAELAPLDPMFAEFQDRQILRKLVTDYMPHLRDTDVIHPSYDILKATGRTSSFAGSLFPSCNIQQVDPRVRQCFVARKGHVLVSVDYSGIDLCAFAQATYDLFGKSVHMEKLQAGVDLHAYLGAQLAVELSGPEWTIKTRGDVAYDRFLETRGSYGQPDVPYLPGFYKKWRDFSKPVGLGFPGGMGIATFVAMAKRDYGLDVTEAQAKQMKKIWLETYPEAVKWFKHIRNDLKDPHNSGKCPRTGDTWDLYAYYSPMGMYRAGADYCAASNGEGLQSPAADGAKAAVFTVGRACYDHTQESILFGTRPVAFIHDELIVEMTEDALLTPRVEELCGIMEEAMGRVLKDVPIKTEAAIMRRWDKAAESDYDDNKQLTIWEPAC